MHCFQAQKKLNEADFNPDDYNSDKELMDHLNICPACASLLRAESDIRADISLMQQEEPEKELPISLLKEKIQFQNLRSKSGFMTYKAGLVHLIGRRYFRRFAFGIGISLLIFLALIPFDFEEKIGYEISISGVDKSIALDSKGIVPLLDALGMDRNKVAALLNSLEKQEVHLKVGECSETCHLKISDLKTERDVHLLIEAIIELGCCEIDNVFPIFRNKSSSLLRRATTKLFS